MLVCQATHAFLVRFADSCVFLFAGESCTSLRSLRLSRCSRITDKSLRYLASTRLDRVLPVDSALNAVCSAEGCRSLALLHVSHCAEITDIGCQFIGGLSLFQRGLCIRRACLQRAFPA